MLKIMRVRYVTLFFIGTAFVCGMPNVSFAATDITDDVVSDTEWNASGNPYIVSSTLTIQSGATLTIDPGVVVQFDSGSIDVLGRLLAKGTVDEPITFTSATDDRWYGIDFENQETASSLEHVIIQHASTGISDYYSKELSLSNIRIENGRYGIEAYGSHLSLDTFSAENMSDEALDISYGSDVILKNLVLKNVEMSVQVYVDSKADISNLFIDGARGEALAVYVGSSVRVASSTIKNVSHSYGAVEVFVDSSLDISGLTLDDVSGGDALSVFDNSQMTVQDSSISNTKNYEAISAFDSGSLVLKNVNITGGTGDGVAVFSGGAVDIQDSVISGFSNGAGVVDYGSNPEYYPANSLSLTNSEIKNNDTGVGLYSNNLSYSISNNSIHDNVSYGFGFFYGTGTVDVSHNFWSDPSGPYNNPDNLTGTGDAIWHAPGSTVTFSPWLSYWGTPPVSNVLFLPGIEGSRLYEGTGCGKDTEEKLWEPIGESFLKILRGAGDNKVKSLFLDQNGASVCSDIYTKADGIIDSVKGNVIYQLFIEQMNGLETDGTIHDWKPVAYDWRLSLTDLLSKGTERDGKIYYEEATSTPYIEQTLRVLAASSKTKKVTIVSHSNGGLVTKALLNKLGNEAAALVDKIIMVGAPQSGAPVAIGALLYGLDQGISKWGIPILHSAVARELALNSPMAYHLLPSQDYFDSVMYDAAHPVARFAGDAYAQEISAYGSVIGNLTELDDFLLAEALNADLIDYTNNQHATLDFWSPPEGIEVSQIAGWGADTVAGIDFYTPPPINALTVLEPMRAYRPIFTEDGDGVVPVPSALMMAENTNVKRYWVNLDSYRKDTSIKIEHKNIFEIQQLEDFIKNILNNNIDTLPFYISSSQPPPNVENKKLTFFLHSPLTLELIDSSGNVTGLAEDGSMTQDIPDSTYGEFGDVKYITVPQGSAYQLTMHGQDSGIFSLDIQESSGGVITASSTIANVPTTASTLASLTISGGIDTASALSVDVDGDGQSEITITPEVGETVNYEPSASAPVSRSGSRSRSSTHITTPVATTTSTTITIAQPVVTGSTSSPQANTPKVVATTKPVQVKNPSTSLEKAPAKKVDIPPQTASVYDAVSQQSVLQKLGRTVYNGLHRLWRGLKVIFLIQK